MTDINLDEFDRAVPERVARHRESHPAGFEPGLTYNPEKGGSLVVKSDEEIDPALWANLIADFGLDPNYTKVVPGSVQVRAWDAAIGNNETKRMLYYRATLTPRSIPVDDVDVTELIAEVKKWKPSKHAHVDECGRALVVLLSDWQLGKVEPIGDGPEATVGRIMRALDGLVRHIKDLKKIGRPVDTIYLVGLGDIVEQCSGFYSMQTSSVSLDRREQMRLGRRLVLKFVDTLLPLGTRIVLAAVPGNHGENRQNGKAYTSWTDNDDLAIFEQVSEILAANCERYERVSVPLGAIADNLTLTLEVAGIPVAFAHGHQFSGSGGSQAVMERWWRDQVMGRQPVADAELLFAGHKHHFVASESTGRTVFQCPAMDGGSYWFTAQTGNQSPAGMLAVGIGAGYGQRGWGDLVIL